MGGKLMDAPSAYYPCAGLTTIELLLDKAPISKHPEPMLERLPLRKSPARTSFSAQTNLWLAIPNKMFGPQIT